MRCVFAMVVVSILPHAEFGPNEHRKDAPHFIKVHCLRIYRSYYIKTFLDDASKDGNWICVILIMITVNPISNI